MANPFYQQEMARGKVQQPHPPKTDFSPLYHPLQAYYRSVALRMEKPTVMRWECDEDDLLASDLIGQWERSERRRKLKKEVLDNFNAKIAAKDKLIDDGLLARRDRLLASDPYSDTVKRLARLCINAQYGIGILAIKKELETLGLGEYLGLVAGKVGFQNKEEFYLKEWQKILQARPTPLKPNVAPYEAQGEAQGIKTDNERGGKSPIVLCPKCDKEFIDEKIRIGGNMEYSKWPTICKGCGTLCIVAVIPVPKAGTSVPKKR